MRARANIHTPLPHENILMHTCVRCGAPTLPCTWGKLEKAVPPIFAQISNSAAHHSASCLPVHGNLRHAVHCGRGLIFRGGKGGAWLDGVSNGLEGALLPLASGHGRPLQHEERVGLGLRLGL